MDRDKSRESYEDQVIAVADSIKKETFDRATERWQATPDEGKQRPWPRCHSIECNRSLVCKVHVGGQCEGFDF